MSVYLFYGTENYLIEEEINKITNSLIPEEERDLNITTYDAMHTPIEEIIQDAETLPFFAKHKVIIVRNSFFFTGQKATKSVEHQLDALEQYLNSPVDYSSIIFWTTYEKIDERKKIVKSIKKNGKVKVFTQLNPSSLLEWVKKQASLNQNKITDEAADLLIDTIGQNLLLLSQEINKMSIYAGKEKLIDKRVVEELSTRSIEQNIFSLIEKVANLEIDQAFQMFYDLIKNKEEPVKMVALFARQFRMILHTKELNRVGYSEKQIASMIGAHPYSVKIALNQARKFNEKQLKEILKKLAEIDYDIKSGRMDKILSLEMFMFHLKELLA